jgi:putative SOS response-associated peptidase YedK
MPAKSCASGAWYRPTIRTGRPNIGDHTLFSIMTTEPNGIVEPIHEKAMPVMLMTPDEVEAKPCAHVC